MPDPGAPSGAVAEITFTAGTGPYQLNPTPPHALAAYFRFADVFPEGGPVTIEVDDTAQKEIVTGTFDTASNTISRDQVLYSSNGNALIDWPDRGQRTVRPLSALPICDTPPIDGQVLAWDSLTMKWCPATITIPNVPPGFAVCSTPPLDGQVLVWNGTEWCPADFCALVDACMNPPLVCTWDWTSQSNAPGPFNWYAATISDDGSTMAAFEASSPAIVVTYDAGVTWMDVTPAGLTVGNSFVAALASDSSGLRLLTGSGGAVPQGPMYLSTNGGFSWTTITLTDGITGQGNEGGFSLAMSANGSKMIAGTGNFGRAIPRDPFPCYVWVSLDYGGTWVQQAALATSSMHLNWSVFMARDGSAFVAINGDRAFISLDGSSWTAMTNPFFPDEFHPTMAMTSGASRMITAHRSVSDFIMESTDQGNTWSPITTLSQGIYGGNSSGATIAMSLDGQTIAVGSQDAPSATGPLFVSCDGGATWAAVFTGSPPFGFWNTVFVTPGGDRMAVANQGPVNNFPHSGLHTA